MTNVRTIKKLDEQDIWFNDLLSRITPEEKTRMVAAFKAWEAGKFDIKTREGAREFERLLRGEPQQRLVTRRPVRGTVQ